MGLNRVSTGITGLDRTIDMLRLGDNVVWQVSTTEDYKRVLKPYVAQALADERTLVYIRFGRHEPLLEEDERIHVCNIDPACGFESFAIQIHSIAESYGKRTFYVFDCLTDLLEVWFSDLMIMNFFKVTCPYLYEMETVAYFSVVRDAHTFHAIAGIRETTQLLLDIYRIEGSTYIHPLKV